MSTVTIKVAEAFADHSPVDCSNHDARRIGPTEGEIAWRHAMAVAADHADWLACPLEAALSAACEHARGVWSTSDAVDDASATELLAALVQDLARDLRLCGAGDGDWSFAVSTWQKTDWTGCEYPLWNLRELDGAVVAEFPLY